MEDACSVALATAPERQASSERMTWENGQPSVQLFLPVFFILPSFYRSAFFGFLLACPPPPGYFPLAPQQHTYLTPPRICPGSSPAAGRHVPSGLEFPAQKNCSCNWLFLLCYVYTMCSSKHLLISSALLLVISFARRSPPSARLPRAPLVRLTKMCAVLRRLDGYHGRSEEAYAVSNPSAYSQYHSCRCRTGTGVVIEIRAVGVLG